MFSLHEKSEAAKGSPALAFIFVTLFIDVLGMGLLAPILPNFIKHLSHQDLSGASHDYGILLAIYGAMQFLFSPLLGMLSDKYGRRPVLLLSMLFNCFDYIIMALAPSMIWLYIGRTLSGITGASITAASAYIADVSPPEKRAQNFGLIGAAFGIGFVIGPAAGGLLGQWGTRIPFWVAAALCLANFIYGWLILPESLRPENRRNFQWSQANPVGALKILAKYPVVWALTGTLIATNLSMQCVSSTWVLFTMAQFKWNEQQNGISMACFGAMMLVYQLGVARLIFPAWGEKRVMKIGLIVAAVEFTAYAFCKEGWMTYVVMIVGGLGLLAGQATQGLLSRQVDEDQQGTLQGALASLASLTGIFGPLIATALFAYFTRAAAPIKIPGIAFILGGLLNLVGFLIAMPVLARLPNPKRGSAEPATAIGH